MLLNDFERFRTFAALVFVAYDEEILRPEGFDIELLLNMLGYAVEYVYVAC